MIRVLATSSGVVKPAATPPARLPQAAASSAGKSATSPEWVLLRARNSFSRSYSGNCRQVNGICAAERTAVQSRARRVRLHRSPHLARDGGSKAAVKAAEALCPPDGLRDGPTAAAGPSRRRLTPLFHDFGRYSHEAGCLRMEAGVRSCAKGGVWEGKDERLHRSRRRACAGTAQIPRSRVEVRAAAASPSRAHR